MPYKDDIFLYEIHFPAMILELLVFIFSLIIAIIIFFKWKERKTIATLYLAIAILSIALAVFIVFTGLASWFFKYSFSVFPYVTSPAYYPLTLPLGYSLVVVYDVFLFLFTIQIFMDKNDKKVIPVAIIGIFMVILSWLPSNYWGFDNLLIDPPSTRTLAMAIFLVYNVTIYLILFYYAFKESKLTEQKEYRVGFRVIAMGQIANILIFICFLGDAILLLLNPGSPGFSIFIYLAWVSALIANVLFYLGFILPSWFRNYINR